MATSTHAVSAPAPDRSLDDPLMKDLLAVLDQLAGGVHPGFRPAHAKGIMCEGTFKPTAQAVTLSRAPHFNRPSTRVVVRYSASAGVPTVPDNDPVGGTPRGMAVRFYLGDHKHTDIVAQTANGFACRTPEEFLELLRAVAASGPGVAHPTPVEQFVGSHPAALRFVTMPKPIASSFARDTYFPVVAFHFTNAAGASQFGKYRFVPEAGNDHLTPEQAAAKSPDFLRDEIDQRLARGPVRFRVVVTLASDGDPVDDATAVWPAGRPEVELGTIELTKRLNHDEPELHKIIFDPIPRVDGIESTGDPLMPLRAAIYLLSGRRRRAAGK